MILLNKGKQGLAKRDYEAHERIPCSLRYKSSKCLILEEISNLKIHLTLTLGKLLRGLGSPLLCLSLSGNLGSQRGGRIFFFPPSWGRCVSPIACQPARLPAAADECPGRGDLLDRSGLSKQTSRGAGCLSACLVIAVPGCTAFALS